MTAGCLAANRLPRSNDAKAVTLLAFRDRLHVDRTFGRDRHHWYPGFNADAGVEPGQRQSERHEMHQQSQADRHCALDLRGREPGQIALCGAASIDSCQSDECPAEYRECTLQSRRRGGCCLSMSEGPFRILREGGIELRMELSSQ